MPFRVILAPPEDREFLLHVSVYEREERERREEDLGHERCHKSGECGSQSGRYDSATIEEAMYGGEAKHRTVRSAIGLRKR
jgi:hypothetical protein